MDDSKIVDLYWERSENAINETQKKYGRYCHSIAYHVLYNEQDTEECVNDTYVAAWNAIPPKRPAHFQQFLGKIARNIALDRYDYNSAAKRSCETEVVLDEFWECVPDSRTEVSAADELALKEIVNRFLASLGKRTRIVFMRRYWYMCSVKEIAGGMRMSESNVKVTLHRTREKFRACLEKEGIFI